jgi:outer membrane lipoprotein carrier protein
LKKETKNIKSLTTDFIQYKHLDFLSKDIETSGKMAFKSPNLLNWQYTSPYQYSIIFKNNKVYINDQGNKTTIDANSKMFEKINKLIIGSVSGNMFDDKEFLISYYKTKEFYITKLTPKTATIKKYIQQVDLYFPINETTVSQVKLIEPSNDFTRIVFKNKQINAKVDDSVFSN